MVGVTGALVGSAVIGGIGSAISSGNNKKAINAATDASTAATDRSIALQRDVYNSNSENLSPFMARGNRAGDAINALLGLGGPEPAQLPGGARYGNPTAATTYAPYGGNVNPNFYSGQSFYGGEQLPFSGGDFFGVGGRSPGFGFQNQPSRATYQTPSYSAAEAPESGQSAYERAFDNFKDSTGYRYRVDEGNEAINSGYAARGALRSGAALKALQDRGQNVASNEFGRYLGYLGNQQGVGLSGASALAGVGQGFANNVSNLEGQNAATIGNAAIARANNNNNFIGSVAGGIGTALGSSFGG